MGYGDVKLLAMVGTFLTPVRSLVVLLLGSLLGSVLGLVLRATFGSRLRDTEGTLGEARILAAKTVASRPARRLLVLPPRGARLVALVEGPVAAPGASSRLDWVVPVDEAFVETPTPLRLETRVVSVAARGGDRSLVTVELPPLRDDQDDAVWGFHAARIAIPFGPFLAVAGAIVVMHAPEIEHFVGVTWPSWVRSWFGRV
jgi:hypothetical protein